jgi:hypothetical protein
MSYLNTELAELTEIETQKSPVSSVSPVFKTSLGVSVSPVFKSLSEVSVIRKP